MNHWDDEQLETLFQRMREEELPIRPEFVKMWHAGCRARSRQRRRTMVASMALIAALAIAFILRVLPTRREIGRVMVNVRPAAVDLEVFSSVVVEQFRDSPAVAWRSPTDFLLEPAVDGPVSLVWWNYEPVTN